MKTTWSLPLALSLAVSPPLARHTEAAQKGALSLEAQPLAKTLQYTSQDVPRINTKLRYMTLIVLPAQEQILDFTCGDKDYWNVSGTQNLAYVKPAKAGARTNVNLITASG